MADRNRYDDRERRWRDRDRNQGFFDRVGNRINNWFRDRDEDRDFDQNRSYYRDYDRDWDRDYDWNRSFNQNYNDWDRTRQWRPDQESDRYSYGDRYGQNYERGRGYEDEANWYYGNRQTTDRDQNRYRQDYGRSYNRGLFDRDRYRDFDYEDQDELRYRGQGGWEDEQRFGTGSYQNRGPQGRGYNRGNWGRSERGLYGDRYRSAGMGSDYDTGYGYDQGARRRYGRAEYGNQYGTAGMRSDFDPNYDYDTDTDDYRNFDRGYVGYDREGAFYQDLDEPYTYEYWEFWMVPGEFSGVGPENYQRSDDRIKEQVCERLTRHGRIDATDVEINVQDGEVTLTGSVMDREMKRIAEDTAESVWGVKEVNNQIRVRKEERERTGWRGEQGSEQSMRAQSSTTSGSTMSGSTPTGSTSTFGQGGMEEKRRQLREGMEVIGKNGKVVGKVKEVRNSDFLVDRDMARDVYIPYEAVKSVGSQALLTVGAEEVDQQNWETPDLLR